MHCGTRQAVREGSFVCWAVAQWRAVLLDCMPDRCEMGDYSPPKWSRSTIKAYVPMSANGTTATAGSGGSGGGGGGGQGQARGRVVFKSDKDSTAMDKVRCDCWQRPMWCGLCLPMRFRV